MFSTAICLLFIGSTREVDLFEELCGRHLGDCIVKCPRISPEELKQDAQESCRRIVECSCHRDVVSGVKSLLLDEVVVLR